MVLRRERAIAELCLGLEPDIVHCHDVGALPVGLRVKARRRCKLVFDAHEICDQLAQAPGSQNALNRYVVASHADRIDAFVTINESIAAYYRENFPALPRSVVVRNAALRCEPFRYDGRLHEAARLEPSDKILLYQGGFAQRRGLMALVEAAPLLPEGWAIVMMGWGRLEEELRRTARANMSKLHNAKLSRERRIKLLRNRIRIIPPAPQAELPLWTAGATIGIIPYENAGLNHWFSTPNKLWEYPNAGVPILASPFPEMRKVIEGFGIGWLLPVTITGKNIADAVSEISDEEIAEAKANCARFLAEDNWTNYAARLVDLYRGLQRSPEAAPRRWADRPGVGDSRDGKERGQTDEDGRDRVGGVL